MAQYKHAAIQPDASDHQGKTFLKEIAAKKVINLMFEKVFADPELSPMFEHADAARLKHMQEVLMDVAFGGLQALESVYLRESHLDMMKHHGLCERHWERFVKHFEVVLHSLGAQIPDDKKKAAIANIRATRMYFGPLRPGE